MLLCKGWFVVPIQYFTYSCLSYLSHGHLEWQFEESLLAFKDKVFSGEDQLYDLFTMDNALIWEIPCAWDFALPGLWSECRFRAMAYRSAKGDRHRMKKEMLGLLPAFRCQGFQQRELLSPYFKSSHVLHTLDKSTDASCEDFFFLQLFFPCHLK